MTNREVDRLAVMTKLINKQTNGTEAALQLGVSTRQIRRMKKRVKKDGPTGLVHRGRGKPSKRKITRAIVETIIQLLLTMYVGFGPTFAAEKLFENHQIKISDETLRAIMIKNNLWKPKQKKKNKQHRAWRPRREHYGSLQQYDGCYHHWFEDRAGESCLLLAVDDATGNITHAWFDYHEGVLPTFGFWKTYVEKNGKPAAIYLDKFSTYKINHKAAQDNTELITQFERACLDLGVKLITAHSPEAKGRVERMFHTLQDRLVKELRLRNISDAETANKFLIEEYMPKFNQQFSVVPEKQGDTHRPLTALDQEQIHNIFSIHSTRIVMNDFTVRFENKYFQLNQQQPVLVCRKDQVLVEEHLDGTTVLKLRDKKLSYIVLPKRPEKTIKLKIAALTTGKPTYQPLVNHPWRRQFLTSKSERVKLQIIQR